MIKVIYFDFFNVLCNPPLSPIIERIIPNAEQQKHIDRLDDLDLGNISLENFVIELSIGSGIPVEQITDEMDSAPKLNMDLLEFIKNKLKGHYRVGLFTNAINTTIYKILGDNINTFDIKLISSEVKLIKPNKKIFELAVALAEVNPEEILFIDDSKKNIDAAKEMGIQTIHYKYFEDFKTQIDAILNF